MRHDPEFFGDQELVLVYVATRIRKALALEDVLDRAAVDYAVVPTYYTGGILFHSQRVGAFFYVAPDSEREARAQMREHGFKPYENA